MRSDMQKSNSRQHHDELHACITDKHPKENDSVPSSVGCRMPALLQQQANCHSALCWLNRSAVSVGFSTTANRIYTPRF
ncbi:hypothetical protein CEXT_520571 [Caerostris extrusa]|uniref:Uncharacterized protein n=1 Tax=Caerostris extrusa TaxID=172846 RepID=A0AAV4T5B7_CAEEX|nr:hypothetical protein CEXT_520571 [Caerostris extrusa]